MSDKIREVQELHKRYGNLLDKYLDNAHADYLTREEREEEARKRYGNLLDKAKPDTKLEDDAARVEDSLARLRWERAKEYEEFESRRQERIERKKREEQERNARYNAFINDFIEKKKAEQKAEEERRKRIETEQSFLNNVQRIIDIKTEMSEKIARTNRMLKYNEERRKEHEEQMKWFERQRKK